MRVVMIHRMPIYGRNGGKIIEPCVQISPVKFFSAVCIQVNMIENVIDEIFRTYVCDMSRITGWNKIVDGTIVRRERRASWNRYPHKDRVIHCERCADSTTASSNQEDFATSTWPQM